MKFNKIICLAASCAIAAGSILTIPFADSVVSAVESKKTDLKWYDDVITLVQDDVASNGQHAQWYYMTDQSPFRTDGLNVTYNSNVVTDDCDIAFNAGDAPSKYYNGKTFEYDIPINIEYGGKDIKSSVIAQIGKKNDANLDHMIDVRDAAIISRDVRTHIVYKKTNMSEFAKFLVTGNRKSNVYALKAENASTIAKNLAEEAIKRATGKKLERFDSTSGCSLSISSAKGRPGESIALQVIVNADNNFEALDAVVEWDSDTMRANGLYPSKGVSCETAIGDGKMAIVNYGDSKIPNGAVSTINVTIPEDAKPGENLELYFSDVKTFSVLGSEGSENISDNINIKGAKIEVLEPATTKPAVTTTNKTTTSSVTTTSVATVTSVSESSSITSLSGFNFVSYNADLSDCTVVKPNRTVDMELTYKEAYELVVTPILPEGMKLVKSVDNSNKELSVNDDGSFTVNGGKAVFTIELPEDIKNGEYKVKVKLNAADMGNIAYMLANEPVGTITVKDEEVTTPVTTTSKVTTSTTVTTTTPTTTTKPVILGDVNRDGKCDVRDASYLAQLIAKKKTGDIIKEIADFNKDGKIDIRDAAAIAKSLSTKKK